MTNQFNHESRRFACVLMFLLVLAACEMPAAPEATTSVRAGPGDSSAASAERPSPGDESAPNAGSRSVVAETLAYAEVNNALVKGHFVFPEDMVDPLPAVLLIHEWWGLDDRMRAMADRLAGEGFIVLAVDLYSGKVASTPNDARTLMLEVVENPALATENIAKALDWIFTTTGATEVATLGYGFGGGWALHAALNSPEKLDAVVVLYGQVSTDEQSLGNLNMPLLGLFGAEDSAVPVETVEEFKTALQRLRKDFEIEIYPGAKGGFASPGNRNFDPVIAADSWLRVATFLHEELVDEKKAK